MTPERWESLPKKIMAAGAIFQNPDGDVLLVKPTYRDGWQLPGGVVEQGESPRIACLREVAEELGQPFSVMRPVLVDYTRELNGFLVDHLEWIFEGEVLDAGKVESIQVDGAEISEYRFASRRKIDLLVEGLHRKRIARALEAIDSGIFSYGDDEPCKFRT
jgi:8-oxo-dGTP diphosphatase